MIPRKRASQCADVLVAIYRYEDWQLVSFKAVSLINVKAIAWCNDYQFANIQYTMGWNIFVADLMYIKKG